MKNYNDFVLEFVKNEKYAKYILNKLVDEIKIISPKITNTIRYDRKFYIICNIDEVDEELSNKMINIINKYKKNLEKIGVILSYKYNTDNFILYYKDLYVKRFYPPKYVYHSTHISNVESILQDGLKVKPLQDSAEWNFYPEYEYPPAIFVTVNELWDSSNKSEVLRIDTSKINNKWWNDLNLNTENHFMTFENIPKEAIELVNKKTLKPIK